MGSITQIMILNKTQEHFLKVFKNDVPDNDFDELKSLIKSWLGKKLMDNMDSKSNYRSSRYCLNIHIDEFTNKCKELDIEIYTSFPNEHYTWMQIKGDRKNLDQLTSID